MTGLVLLQNAWSPLYAGREWPRDRWLAALACCRTGRRLQRVLPADVWYDNTTRQVAASSTGRCPPDRQHVQRLLDQSPQYVVACGRQAGQLAVRMWSGRLIVTNHPGCRIVTNALLDRLGELVRSGQFHRIELVQERGGLGCRPLPHQEQP